VSLGATKAVSRVSPADLRRVRALSLGDYVVSGQWLGRVVEVSMDTEITFDDGAVCRVADAASGKIKPAKTHAYLPETNTALYPGARVVINQEDSSVVFMEERWLSGQWKPDHAEGTVTNADHTDEQLSSSSLPVTMAVSFTCTSVEVLWQNGTRQTMAHSAVEFASDLDFFPGEYVIDNSVADDDAMDAMAMGAASGSKRRVGVVRSLNSKEHMVKVSWFKAAETGPGGWEVECEDTVSAYELARDPDYSAFYGDVVVRLQSDVSESTPLAQKQAQALSWVGHVVDLHVDGHVQVKWGDGSTSTVCLHPISFIFTCLNS
jgi:ubiquitin-conjugating enzyme E2 O